MKERHGVCPSCESENSYSVNNEYADGVYTDTVQCEDCGANWKETFVYSGFELLKKE